MADIFDEISLDGDIFDQVAETEPATFAGGGGGQFGGRGASGSWEEPTLPGKVVGAVSDYEHKLRGAFAKGGMKVGQAITQAPSVAIQQVGFLRQAGIANAILDETDPEKQAQLRKQLFDSEQLFKKISDWVGQPAEIHKIGQKIIEQNHPEWESDPPENFIDLVTHPGKLGIALAESAPVLIGAGILSAAGAPNLGVAMMYVTEGQQAYDQAIADRASEDEAAIAYGIYGSVSAMLEQMQLQGVIKVAKGSYNTLLNRTVQKVAKRGLGSVKGEIIKVAAQEALEEMAQGAWQEITAKTVYGQDIPGGVADFIDRRAQEAYIAGMMGLIPGVGGAAAGRIQGGVAVTKQAGDELVATDGPVTKVEKKTQQFPETAGFPKEEKAEEQETYYHGTSISNVKKIEQKGFKPKIKNGQYYGSGVYLTPSKDVALKYGEGAVETTLNLKNPYILDIDKYRSVEEWYEEIQQHIEEPLINEYGEAVTVHQTDFEGGPTSKLKPEAIEASQAISNFFEEQGYDGIIVQENGKTSEIIVFNPEQVGIKPTVTEPQPKPKPQRLTLRKAKKLGHTLPEKMGWDDAQRRDFMQQLVGKSSMKGMTPKEARIVVEAMQEKVREAGLEYIPEPVPVDELVATLKTTKKTTELEPSKEMNRGQIRSLGRKIKSGGYSFVTGLERMERFFESLDGHKTGAFTKNIWEPVRNADELAIENSNKELSEFMEHLADQDVDTTLWLGKVEQVGDTKWNLTPFQRIGVYMLGLNKNGKRQLIEGMEFSEDELVQVINSLTPRERTVAEWLLEKYDQQWKVIKTIAAQSGINPAKLKKEFRYSPIIRTDADLETQEDFLSGLSDAFTGENYDPEHKFLETRKPSASGKVELDAAIIYMHNIARTQRFLQMAPVANKVGRILNNKKFRTALNKRTYGQGGRLVNKWMKDAVRGVVAQDSTDLAKFANIMRRNGIVYAIGYNIPSSLRQSLSLSNAIAVDKAMLRHVPINLAKAATPKGYKQMEDFVFSRSLQVKNSSFDRDLRTKANKAGLKLKLRGKQSWSQRAISWIRWMDQHTRVVAWKSLYDTGMGKFNGDEQKAMSYADKWVARTQPMASTKDLPHFFRGSTFEKLLTTFQNQINNNANFYVYDILGATKAGEITLLEAGHRVMFSYVLPAVLFGIIGRGGLPKDITQVVIDLITYPIAGAVVVGRWITAMIQGWDKSSTIAEAGPEEASKLVGAIKRGDIEDIIKYAATTIGALTGKVPAQAVRTAEGVLDIAAGETQDPRRLVYSEWALKQGEKKKEKIKPVGGYIP